jgi:peptidoglycan hydrolase-like protein with peptidoglycan-binding domain
MLQGRLKTLATTQAAPPAPLTAAPKAPSNCSRGTSPERGRRRKPEAAKGRFATGAPKCSQYIELKYGDSGTRGQRAADAAQKDGYFDGSLGGHFGTQTQSAVKAFQRDMGLKQTASRP